MPGPHKPNADADANYAGEGACAPQAKSIGMGRVKSFRPWDEEGGVRPAKRANRRDRRDREKQNLTADQR